jgi:uncharacterized protein YrrD
MIKYQDLLGKTAYSLEEGRQWGRIIELFVDKKDFSVKAMAIKGEEDKALMLSSVKNIDESVIFQSALDLLPLSSAETGNIRANKITGLKAITENGNEIGTIVAFYFKTGAGEITHYEISKSVVKENLLMSQDGLVRMGDDAMIITEEAAEVAAEMKSKDNLRKTVAELGKKAQDFAAKAKGKINEYRTGAKEGIEKLKKGAKEASDKYGPGMREFGNKVNQGMSAAGTRAQEISDKYGPKIKEGAQKAEAKFKEAADKYGPKIKEGAQKAEAKFKEAADKYGPKIKEAGSKAKDAAKGAWDSIKGKKKKTDDDEDDGNPV